MTQIERKYFEKYLINIDKRHDLKYTNKLNSIKKKDLKVGKGPEQTSSQRSFTDGKIYI